MTSSGSQNPYAVLKPLAGPAGRPIQIAGESARIGQGPQNDVILDDDTVSTNHARLDFADGAWSVTDLGSRNGTFVDGERLPTGGTAALAPETPVRFGAVKLVFSPVDAVDLPPAADAVPPPSKAAPPVPLTERPGFRLPVWVLLLIILVVAIIIMVVLWVGGSVDPAAAADVDAILVLALQINGSIP